MDGGDWDDSLLVVYIDYRWDEVKGWWWQEENFESESIIFLKKIVACILPTAYSFLPIFSYFGEIRDLGWSCKVWFEENRLSQLDFE